jgi:hypothetical protein
VDLPLSVEKGDAFEDGDEGIEDFLLGVVDDLVSLLPVFEFYLEGGESLGVEESVVVDDGADECCVREVGCRVCLALSLEVLVCLLAGLVQQQNVSRLEFYYAELLAYCSLRHPLRIYFVYYIFH